MTYLKFTLWLLGLYIIYYALVILWDLLKTKRNTAGQQQHELSFAESFAPIQPEFELAMNDVQSSVIASGGVVLKQFFKLAQEEKIEFTSQVSF